LLSRWLGLDNGSGEIIPCVSEYLTQMTVLIYADEQSETDQFKVLANASSTGTWFE
jgi:hypothetical protein